MGESRKRQLDEEIYPTLFDTVSLIIPISNQKKKRERRREVEEGGVSDQSLLLVPTN